MAGSSRGPMICSAREVVSEVESGPRAISVTRSLFASRSASNMSVRQAYSLFQLTGHTVGVALAPGDIIDQLLPLILGSFGFEGAGNGVQYERLYFSAHLALGPAGEHAAFDQVIVVLLHCIDHLWYALAFDGSGLKDG